MYYEDRIYKIRRILLYSAIAFLVIISVIAIYLYFNKGKEEASNQEEKQNIFSNLLPKSAEKQGEEEENIVKKEDNLGLPEGEEIINEENDEGAPEGEEDILKELAREEMFYGTDKPVVKNINNNITKSVSVNQKNQKVRFYDYDQNQFYKIDENGEKKLLSDKKFYKVKDITWSPTEDKAVLEYADGHKIIYDFQREKQYTIPSNWTKLEFSPQGDSLAFVEESDQNDYRWLAVSDNTGNNKRLIKHLGMNADKIKVQWSPDQRVVAEYPEIENLSRSKLYLLGPNKEVYQGLYVDGADVRTNWSPEADQLLVSAYSPASNFNPQLEIIKFNPNTKEAEKKLKINLQTWADKCVFKDNKTIYCAVPQKMIEGAGLQPDVMKYSTDDIYMINTETGETKKIMNNKDGYTINNLTITENGTLYFIDPNTGMLYKINI